jgi:Transglutaminase-like superfamily
MKYLSCLYCFLICALSLSAQNIKYGKISVEDFKDQSSPLDSSAPAEILYKSVNHWVSKEYQLSTEVFVRMRIFDKEKAEKFLQFRHIYYNRDNISAFKATTYNLKDQKVEETQLEKSQKFVVKYNKYNNIYKTTFPNVQNGSIIEYKYTKLSDGLNTDRQYFQYEIPLRNGIFTYEYPEFIYYKPDIRGYAYYPTSNLSKRNWSEGYNANVLEYQYKDVPAVLDEPFVLNDDNIRSSVKCELTGVYIPGRIYKNISETWEKVATQLKEHEDFGYQIMTGEKLKTYVKNLIGNEPDTSKQVKLLFNHVQQNYKWNGEDGLYTDEGTDKCFEKKTGNASEINFLLISMLKASGIKAFPFVLSTTEHGLVNPNFPSLYALNYVICVVKYKGNYTLMDASAKYSSINVLPEKCLNYYGYALEGDVPVLLTIANRGDSKTFVSAEGEFDADFNLHCKVKETYGSFYAMQLMEGYDNKENFEQKIGKKIKFHHDSLITNYQNGNLEVAYNMDTKELVDILPNKLVFNPLLFLFEEKNPFAVDQRIHPIEFGTPFNHISRIKIKIPKGYKVENMPKDKKVMAENSGDLMYTFTTDGEYLQAFSIFKIKRSNFLAEEYEQLKELWQHKIDAEGQLVSLVKE